jgi:hypothetical protein
MGCTPTICNHHLQALVVQNAISDTAMLSLSCNLEQDAYLPHTRSLGPLQKVGWCCGGGCNCRGAVIIVGICSCRLAIMLGLPCP